MEKHCEKTRNLYAENPTRIRYSWGYVQKMIAWSLFVIVAFSALVLYRGNKWSELYTAHGFENLSIRPGMDSELDILGNVHYVTVDEELAKRSVFEVIPQNMTEEEKILLALKLYSIGNFSMVTAPVVGVYTSGNSESVFLGDQLPLLVESVEIRNNITGEYYKNRTQIINPNREVSPLVEACSGMAEALERKYYKAGNELLEYQKTTTFQQLENGELVGDWTKLVPLSERRYKIMTYPTPFCASGSPVAVEPTATGLSYAEQNGKYVPRFTNAYGIEMGYERTDQHFIYDLEDEKLQTVKSAEVSYNEEEGFYTVKMVCDTDKYYSTVDTSWSVTDSESTNDPSAGYTKIEVEFKLWDNGYYKSFELWENWLAENAEPIPKLKIAMGADQHYYDLFTYNNKDCDLERFKFWD